MRKHLVHWLIASGAALGAPGCGEAEGYHPVRGKVLYKGEPAIGAVVYLHREGDHDSAHTTIPKGIVDRYGDFRVGCDGVSSGAPAGSYAVLVEWRAAPSESGLPVAAPAGRPAKKGGPNRVERFTPDRLNGRYLDRKNPRIHAEIKPETNTLPTIELDD